MSLWVGRLRKINGGYRTFGACFETPSNSILILLPFDPPLPNTTRPGSRIAFYGPVPTQFLLPGSPQKKCVWPGRVPSDQHSITFALPHLKSNNTPSLSDCCISKRHTLHHFCILTSRNDQHSITFTHPHLKAINTPSLLHSHISKRSKGACGCPYID